MTTDTTRPDPTRHPTGSDAQRLAAAEKQLAIVLERTDLDAAPALGEAVVDAVAATDRAYHEAAGDSGRLRESMGRDERRSWSVNLLNHRGEVTDVTSALAETNEDRELADGEFHSEEEW